MYFRWTYTEFKTLTETKNLSEKQHISARAVDRATLYIWPYPLTMLYISQLSTMVYKAFAYFVIVAELFLLNFGFPKQIQHAEFP